MIRLPAYLAGVGLVLGSYLFGCVFFSPTIGILTAGMAAFAPVLIDYSINARGYSLLGLFSIAIFLLGDVVRSQKNLAAWLLIILLSALGFYTIPVMLYPFGALMLWLFLSYAFRDVNPEYKRHFLLYLLSCAVLVGLLSFVLYVPIFLQSGIGSVINNPIVSSLSWTTFIESLFARLSNTWFSWQMDLSPWVMGILLAGFILFLILDRRSKKQKIRFVLGVFLWLVIALVLQRVAPPWRVWLFLLPIFYSYSFSGYGSLLSMLFKEKWSLKRWANILIVLLVIGMTTMSVISAYSRFATEVRGRTGPIESITLSIKDILREGQDVIVVTSPDDAPLWYYLRLHDIPDDYVFRIKNTTFSQAYVVVNEALGQTVPEVARLRGSFEEVLDLESAYLVNRYDGVALYVVQHK